MYYITVMHYTILRRKRKKQTNIANNIHFKPFNDVEKHALHDTWYLERTNALLEPNQIVATW